jgi:hypothetical protein
MGAAGTGTETADVALMDDDLRTRVVNIRQTHSNIRVSHVKA